MDKLITFFQQFNAREIAIICWLFIFILWAFSQKNIRNSLFGILKSLFQIKILSVIIAAIIYTGLIVLLLAKIGIWEWILLKDTIYWFLAVAFVLLMNTNKVNQENGFFIKILKDNLKVILVLEFILTLYTFNLITEIILVPILVFIGAMSAVSGLKKEYLPVKKIFDFILSLIGIFFIVFAIGKVFGDFQNIMTSQNLKTFILPPLLTVAFIPFVYFFALIMAYETLFVRLSIFNKNDPALIKFTKRKIIRAYHLNLPKLNRFAKESTQDLMKISAKKDVNAIIKKYFEK
ncbi:MAG: hypothetical protein Q8O95_05990 [bacterium]|nr:hypothetical protein [bacterium]